MVNLGRQKSVESSSLYYPSYNDEKHRLYNSVESSRLYCPELHVPLHFVLGSGKGIGKTEKRTKGIKLISASRCLK
jgi:hypothetical protein